MHTGKEGRPEGRGWKDGRLAWSWTVARSWQGSGGLQVVGLADMSWSWYSRHAVRSR